MTETEITQGTRVALRRSIFGIPVRTEATVYEVTANRAGEVVKAWLALDDGRKGVGLPLSYLRVVSVR